MTPVSTFVLFMIYEALWLSCWEYSGVVEERTGVLEEHSGLVEERSGLVEEYTRVVGGIAEL